MKMTKTTDFASSPPPTARLKGELERMVVGIGDEALWE